jgi:hypothetical protein
VVLAATPGRQLPVSFGLSASKGQSIPPGITLDPRHKSAHTPALAVPRESPAHPVFQNFKNLKEPRMPKNQVSDLITDQEIAFARLVLSGTMTDREAAQSAGLPPDSAAYTKSKPRVRAWMLQHRAETEQRLAQQEAEAMHRVQLRREQVLNRLWEIANLPPESTRGSINGQVKAISMIVAIENLIPSQSSRTSKSDAAIPAAHHPENHAPAVEADPEPAAASTDAATEDSDSAIGTDSALTEEPSYAAPSMPIGATSVSAFRQTYPHNLRR